VIDFERDTVSLICCSCDVYIVCVFFLFLFAALVANKGVI